MDPFQDLIGIINNMIIDIGYAESSTQGRTAYNSLATQAPSTALTGRENYLRELHDLWVQVCAMLDRHRFEEACRAIQHILYCCDQIGEQHPYAAPLFANLGLLRYHLGEFELGANRLVQAVALKPQVAIFRFLLGCMRFDSGHFEQAQLAFEQCLGLFREGDTGIDYRTSGLKVVLDPKVVQHNLKQARIGKDRCAQQLPVASIGIDRIPGGLFFRPPAMEPLNVRRY